MPFHPAPLPGSYTLSMLTLEDCRRFYAEEVQLAANLTLPALIAALERVPREKFLGPGPWQIAIPNLATGTVEYVATPSADPRHVYHNLVIVLDRSRDLTNGHPGALSPITSARLTWARYWRAAR